MAEVALNYRPRVKSAPRSARELPSPVPENIAKRLAEIESLVQEPFRGITTDGAPMPGLFPLRQTGLPLDDVRIAANELLAVLDEGQKQALTFPVDSDAWRRWSNIHAFLMRHGLCLEALDGAQREAALRLLRETLSDDGYGTARDIMRLNETIREITGSDEEYGDWLYWVSLFGEPSATEPWGWQIDGHHLNLNCFVLGDQMVLTPLFMGSEPVYANGGKYAGTRVFEAEERMGLALMNKLSGDQQAKATIARELPAELFTAAFRDNFEMRYEGINADDLDGAQRDALTALIGVYVGRMRSDHAQLRMAEVQRHLGETYFAWMGEAGPDSVYYYRVHSPVILIEFDHQRGVALDNDEPSRNHIHTVVRTPNGNDYGKDLLRQHHERHRH